MHSLTIKFTYMFLLVNHPRGSVVLLPAGHAARLSFDDNSWPAQQLEGDDVYLKVPEGPRLWGQQPKDFADDQLLVHMDNVFDRRTGLLSGFLESDTIVPAKGNRYGLNARVVLDGGTWKAEPAASPNARGVFWTFFKPKGGMRVQSLTDVATYTRLLTSPVELAIVGPNAPTKPIILEPTRSYAVQIVNDHDTRGSSAGQKERKQVAPVGGQEFEDWELTEFEFLYDFLDVGPRPLGPFGRVPVRKTKGTEEPVCGAGQGDPDDPPDPHDPSDGESKKMQMKGAKNWREGKRVYSSR